MGYTLSVIIPIYNSEKTIGKTIESVISSGFPFSYELILVDDGSSDRSYHICEKYASISSNIRLVQKTNGGVSSARNAGLKKATGLYITFIDSDDYVAENYFQQIFAALEDGKDLILFSNNLMRQDGVGLIEKKGETSFISLDEITSLLCSQKINAPWDKVYKTTILNQYQIMFDEDISMGEDLLFNFDYISHCKDCLYLTEPIYNHCLSDQGLTAKQSIAHLKKRQELYEKLGERILKYGMNDMLSQLSKSMIDDLFSLSRKIPESGIYIKKFVQKNDITFPINIKKLNLKYRVKLLLLTFKFGKGVFVRGGQ